jgi:molybdopterin-guanine dinucleotide biosynthesis protein
MNNNKIPVYSIVAFSNTGKTTMLKSSSLSSDAGA